MKMYLAPFSAADETIAGVAEAMNGASPALIREACESIKRSIVLGPRMSLPTDLPAIMDRFGSSASASEGMPEPRLWTDRRAVLNEARHRTLALGARVKPSALNPMRETALRVQLDRALAARRAEREARSCASRAGHDTRREAKMPDPLLNEMVAF